MRNKDKEKDQDQIEELTPESVPTLVPLLPLRDVVIFPYMIFPVLVGRESSIASVSRAIEGDKYVFLCAQRDPNDDELKAENLYQDGTVAKILQVLKLPNGLLKVLVDGIFQARAEQVTDVGESGMNAKIKVIVPHVPQTLEMKALVRQLDGFYREYIKLNRSLPNESLIAYDGIGDDPMRKLYYVAANIMVSVDAKQSILKLDKPLRQFYAVLELVTNEINILKIEMEIDSKVQEKIQHTQRNFFIQEQIRVLQRELGAEEEELPSEYLDLHKRILDAGMPEQAQAKALEEFDKLKKMSMMSPEATVTRNYLDWLLSMPWKTISEDNLSIANARRVLNRDHYGLEKPKDRILEHIAVLNLVRKMKGQILCLVGPPGVGKTSLGKSIAQALQRKFVRIALGGVHDEAEIRGHRRTYIGSMPGKIIQAIKRAGTANPVLLLDEIDKMSTDFQGDPASAMLEVLDPEQNHTFNDHYLDVDFDLSKVMFITTANVRYDIPLPLQDRMEIIELPGYLEHEKLEIARRHLIKKQVDVHGLKKNKVKFSDDAILKIIREYTSEVGVRNLEREIATVCRKLAKQIVEKMSENETEEPAMLPAVDPARIEEFLGVPKHKLKELDRKGRIGSVVGLAWTSFGGDILNVDVSLMKGADKLTLTGQLGDVMKESAHAALSYLRSNAVALGIPEDFYHEREIHIHLPEGAIPKDGPSAGLTMALAMLSAVSRRPARGDVAMTGEITLRGEILPIGGLNEKLLAARRHGITTVLIPKDNMPHLKEVSTRITKGLKIVPVARIEDALEYVFSQEEEKPKPVKTKSGANGR